MPDFNETDINRESAHSPYNHDANLPALQRLLAIMARLRDPDGGCPWDIQQTFATIAPYTIEEAYEVADAIERGDMRDLKDELGDLLLQVAYHSQMAAEQNLFDFDDVAKGICEKLIRRHPHVFAGEKSDPVSQSQRWEEIKKVERAAKVAGGEAKLHPGLFEGIPAGFPALLRSAKLQKRAKTIGFDWPSVAPILAKVEEEWAELKAEVQSTDADRDAVSARQFEEFGDLMFVLVNLGLHLGIDSEAALRAANQKFTRRIGMMEVMAYAKGVALESLTLEEQETLWQAAKLKERGVTGDPDPLPSPR